MHRAGRVAAILLALAALFVAAPPAEAAQNCTLTRTGDVYCWSGAQPVRVQVTGKVVQLSAAGDSTCALTEPGEVYCWGGDKAAAEPSSDDTGVNPLLLISVGLALVGAGFTLVRWGGGQGARSRAVSRHRSAPSLSRSA